MANTFRNTPSKYSIYVPTTEFNDNELQNGEVQNYTDETNFKLKRKAKFTDGTIHTSKAPFGADVVIDNNLEETITVKANQTAVFSELYLADGIDINLESGSELIII